MGEPDINLHTDLRNDWGPQTRVERALCSCLMSYRTPLHDQAWRNAAQAQLPVWHTSFDSECSQIPASELQQIPSVDYTLIQGICVPEVGSLGLRRLFFYNRTAEIDQSILMSCTGRTLAKRHEIDRNRLVQESENSILATTP